jgi:hypothetical protein
MAKRLDTRLESEGAEFLVLGQLLIAGIEATKAYRNFEGFDLYASNPAAGKTCRIQVKSRWATDYDGGFPIKNLSSDFVVFVALNRGYRYRRKTGSSEDGVRAPEFFVFPTPVVEAARDPKSKWGKAPCPAIVVRTAWSRRSGPSARSSWTSVGTSCTWGEVAGVVPPSADTRGRRAGSSPARSSSVLTAIRRE